MAIETLKRVHINISGLVQGVGFRPYIYRLAVRHKLTGWVRNTPEGVEIEVEGLPGEVARFAEVVPRELPPLARIDALQITGREPLGEPDFQILRSAGAAEEAALISPDVATCADCLRELADPGDRRHGYPFINCTNCGPRFTIVQGVPYDREKTTMRWFALCPACRREYGDPLDRRYHAEPNACPVCGPKITLLYPTGDAWAVREEALALAQRLLLAGRIVAVKGLGGFHLACLATSAEAVQRLRRRKGRPDKPLAVMFRDLAAVRRHCEISPEEAAELESPRRPIVLLRRRESGEQAPPALAQSVAPKHGDIGAMLPYAPLHHLLFQFSGSAEYSCLVMTSGNRAEEPIVIDNREAVEVLGLIADAFLVHDRRIWNRCDDSVGYVSGGRLALTRRSRGFTPLPVAIAETVRPTLALGALMCNTFALASGRRVFLSQHIGDVDNVKTIEFVREAVDNLRRWLGLDPEIVACDMHPDLLTTHLARELSPGRTLVQVQHHHAHLAAALAAAHVVGEAQGFALDGTGWGPDGVIWGGELLVGSAAGFRRAGHLRPLPLPGGDAAIKRPARIAAAFLHALLPEAESQPLPLWRRMPADELAVVRRMVDRGFNTPLTTSAGRLFDAVSALLGVADDATYEGQAAIELEQLARRADQDRVPLLAFAMRREGETLVLDPAPVFAGLVEALLAGVPPPDLALAFHHALARVLAQAAVRIHNDGGPEIIAFCGGVFQNRILTGLTAEALRAAGLTPVLPGTIPVNDGGLPLGQVIIANAVSKSGG